MTMNKMVVRTSGVIAVLGGIGAVVYLGFFGDKASTQSQSPSETEQTDTATLPYPGAPSTKTAQKVKGHPSPSGEALSLNTGFFADPTKALGKPAFPAPIIKGRKGISPEQEDFDENDLRAAAAALTEGRDKFHRELFDESAVQAASNLDGSLARRLKKVKTVSAAHSAVFNVPSMDLDFRLILRFNKKALCPVLEIEAHPPGKSSQSKKMKTPAVCPSPDLGQIGERVVWRVDTGYLPQVHERFLDFRIGLPTYSPDQPAHFEGFDAVKLQWILLRSEINWIPKNLNSGTSLRN